MITAPLLTVPTKNWMEAATAFIVLEQLSLDQMALQNFPTLSKAPVDDSNHSISSLDPFVRCRFGGDVSDPVNGVVGTIMNAEFIQNRIHSPSPWLPGTMTKNYFSSFGAPSIYIPSLLVWTSLPLGTMKNRLFDSHPISTTVLHFFISVRFLSPPLPNPVLNVASGNSNSLLNNRV